MQQPTTQKGGKIVATVFMVLFLLTAVLMTLLILIQRGRGGGLAGAFGGPGGHSAFGTKTADVFTRATAVIGAIFFVLSVITAWLMRPPRESPAARPAAPAPAEPAGQAGGGPSEPTAAPADQPSPPVKPAEPAQGAQPSAGAPAAPADAKPEK